MNRKSNDVDTSMLTIGMCIGLAIGTTIGVMTNNLRFWMPLGVSVGMCIGLIIGQRKGGDK